MGRPSSTAPVARGDRRAVRVERRIAQRSGHAVDQLVRRGVLQPLGLGVHAVPRIAEHRREVALDDAVAAQRAQRGAAPRVGEPHAAVALVLEQPLLGEPPHHAAHARRRDAEALGERVRRCDAAAPLQVVDRLQVVLDRLGQLGPSVTARRRCARAAHEQHGDRGAVPHRVRDAAVDDVADEAVAVRRHRDQVAPLALGRREDLVGGVAVREQRVGVEPVARQLGAQAVEVREVLLHLLRLAQRELLEVARGPAVGDVDQHHGRAAQPGERAHVVEDRRVVRRVLERDENTGVDGHGGRVTRGGAGAGAADAEQLVVSLPRLRRPTVDAVLRQPPGVDDATSTSMTPSTPNIRARPAVAASAGSATSHSARP
jgi:hypothetical protein